jgi:hypothetical protein
MSDGILTRLYFGRDDAEHDLTDGLLREGFLPTQAYEEALSGRKTLIIGRKGSGKSAICACPFTGCPVSWCQGELGHVGAQVNWPPTPPYAGDDELRTGGGEGPAMMTGRIWICG